MKFFITLLVNIIIIINCVSQEHLFKLDLECGTIDSFVTLKQSIIDESQKKNKSIPYTIPVVFHIIHRNGYENIPRFKIVDAIENLNLKISGRTHDIIELNPAFEPLVDSINIEFRLASIDENGNCFNGINRVYSEQINFKDIDDITSVQPAWDNQKYLNIWIVPYLNNYSGKAVYPWGPKEKDGIYLRASVLLNLRSTTFIHEVGHWLGLPHIWGSNEGWCEADDGIEDTPPQKKSSLGCPGFPKISCDNGPNGDLFYNYMDYSACRNMFTTDQVERMEFYLNSQSWNNRFLIWQSSNLLNVGIGANPSDAICQTAPNADFSFEDGSSSIPILSHFCNPIQFYNISSSESPNSWKWYFEDGSPTVSFDEHPLVSYNQSGSYIVQLITSNQFGVDTIERTVDLFIFNEENITNFEKSFQNFEDDRVNDLFLIYNRLDDSTSWELAPYCGYQSNTSLLYNSYGHNSYDIEQYFTPKLDLTKFSNAALSFKYAYALKDSNQINRISISATNDCKTPPYIWRSPTFDVSELGSAKLNVKDSLYTPQQNDWGTFSIDLPEILVNKNNIQFVLNYLSFNEACFYLDDIKIHPQLISNTKKNLFGKMEIYPNPFNEMIHLKGLVDPMNYNVKIIDRNGITILNERIPATKTISTSHFPKGIYIISIRSREGLTVNKKIIKI